MCIIGLVYNYWLYCVKMLIFKFNFFFNLSLEFLVINCMVWYIISEARKHWAFAIAVRVLWWFDSTLLCSTASSWYVSVVEDQLPESRGETAWWNTVLIDDLSGSVQRRNGCIDFSRWWFIAFASHWIPIWYRESGKLIRSTIRITINYDISIKLLQIDKR